MNLREAAELAIEALQSARSVFNGEGDTIGGCGWCHALSYGPCEPHCEKDRAVKALRAALADTQDWDEVEALRASLREHMSEIHRLRAAGRQALEALDVWRDCLTDPRAKPGWRFSVVGQSAIAALRAALAEDAMQRLTDVQQEMESVTDCHDLKKARATVIENLLAHFGITSANSDVNLAYLHKQLDNFLAASISCSKDGGKLTLPLEEVEECSYPNCLSSNGCEKQCPAFPRIKNNHFPDATKMVATRQESRQVEPVAYSYTDARGRTVLVSTNTAPYADSTPLYATPPKRKPLTDEEITDIFINSGRDQKSFCRAIERAHGIGGEE